MKPGDSVPGQGVGLFRSDVRDDPLLQKMAIPFLARRLQLVGGVVRQETVDQFLDRKAFAGLRSISSGVLAVRD